HALFDRVGRSLALTEAGQIALAHAERIFGAGDELLATLDRQSTARPPLRVGALSTLSRNFQLQFLRPILREGRCDVVLRSGNTTGLLTELRGLTLDVVLTTELPPAAASAAAGAPGDPAPFAAQRIAEQPVGLHGTPDLFGPATLETLLAKVPLIVPTETTISAGLEALLATLNVTPRIAARVDDMAMVRLLAREGVGLAVAPAVVM
ncbi:MAG: LysR family transcriptional regulator, partial [Pseudomonadota bacterium]